VTGGRNFDGQVIHRHRTGLSADRTSITPYEGELIVTKDGPSPRVFAQGQTPIAGGYFVGPCGKCYIYQSANQDIGFTQVPFNTQVTVTPDFSHSVSVSNTEVTAEEDGEFNIEFTCTVQFTGSATSFLADIQRYNGSTWNILSGGRGWISGTSGDFRNLYISRSIALLAGWKIRVQVANLLLTTGHTVIVGGYNNLNITRIR